MLLLDYQNVLIESILRDRFAPEASPTAIDQIISDFDDCTFHVSTPASKSQILISLAIKCYPELIQYGAQSILEREYGQYIVDPESGYDFSLQIDLENLPESQEAREELVEKVSLLKRNAMAAPYEQAFDEHSSLAAEAAKYTSESAPQGVREGGEVRAIHYREEEAIYIKASHDRVTVIFSTVFREETDRVYGKVFLQEFVDARKRGVQNAPQVLARDEPPLEIQGLPGVKAGRGDITYVTFGSLAHIPPLDVPRLPMNLTLTFCVPVLFPRHLTPQRRQAVISHIQTFRDYFHYHIKASKAYIHSRMRRRTADFLQVLRRARPEEGGDGAVDGVGGQKERKTASGRTFRVQA
ncbi:Arp complex subunit [Elasticomyces elasticus]|nr:Arp complex subunit [Elasticomyces elasticus]